MPSGKAAAIREAVAKENRADLQLERTPWGKTGFVNVQCSRLVMRECTIRPRMKITV